MLNRPATKQASPEQRVFRSYITVVCTLFALLVLRLLFLQVLHSDTLRLKSINNILQAVPTPAARGNIYDRAGRPLAKNVSVYRLLYKPPAEIAEYFPDKATRIQLAASKQQPTYLNSKTGAALEEVQRLGQFLGLAYPDLMRRLNRELLRLNGDALYGYKPACLIDRLEFKQVVHLEEHRGEYEGFFIDEEAFERVYPLGLASAHLLGFTGYASDTDPDWERALGYTIQEKVGKDGVEQAFEQTLHGHQGRRNVEVNRERIFQDIVSEDKPEKGTDIYLTIDAQVEQQAWDALAGRQGAIAIVCLAPGHEGEMIALVSSPSFDPALINDPDYAKKIYGDPDSNWFPADKPSMNRVYRGTFPPGSTFKIVTATTGLQTGAIKPGTSFGCSGKLKLGRNEQDVKYCWFKAGHGYLNLTEAIAKSCDIYFYNVGLSLRDPPGDLSNYAQQFGYGAPVGIGLRGELAGLVPNREWRARRMRANGYPRSDQIWHGGDSANFAIGQGDVSATPLQVLWSAALVAWKGERYEPELLFAHTSGTNVVQEKPKRPRKTKLDPLALDVVARGLRLSVTAGTSKQLDMGLDACAKTGTAENKGNDHSWVVGYYPEKDPRYAFVCLIQHGGHGATAAVPAIKQVLQYMKVHDPLTPPAKARAVGALSSRR